MIISPRHIPTCAANTPGFASRKLSKYSEWRMSALGQKRTSETPAHNVRFTPESGHAVGWSIMSANSQ